MSTGKAEDCTPSTSKAEEFNAEEVNTLMSKGKRHYVCQEVLLAVECFAEACKRLSNKYGQTANECAEAYLYYGKSLLDLARMENNVLGNALQQGPEMVEDDDEDLPNQEGPSLKEIPENEREEVRLQVQEAMSEDAREDCVQVMKDDNEAKKDSDTAGEEADNGEDQEEAEKEEDQEDEDQDEENTEDEGKDEECEDVQTEEAETEKDAGKDEEVSNMQLAWEMLELAKLISAREDSKDSKLRQAEATIGLGEINLELEHYPEAIGDFSECLRLQEGFLEEDDRRLAETNYNLALAYTFDKQFDKAINQFKKAIAVIEKRVKAVETQIEKSQSVGKGKMKASDESEKLQKELKELKDLLPDMAAKIEDAEEMKKSDAADIAAVKQFATEAFGGSSGFDAPCTEEKPKEVSNIGHLVRKKRKPDEEDEKSAVECKKSKQSVDEEVSVNGHSHKNGH